MKLVLKEEMSSTRLIQRLVKPKDVWYHLDITYPEGLSDQMMYTLHQAFDFDYMDSKRFQREPIPAALQFIAEQAKLGQLTTGETQSVFYICPLSYESQVKTVIRRLLIDEKMFHLEKPCDLQSYFSHPVILPNQAVGWLELDNGFFFFADQQMFEKTKALFGIS